MTLRLIDSRRGVAATMSTSYYSRIIMLGMLTCCAATATAAIILSGRGCRAFNRCWTSAARGTLATVASGTCSTRASVEHSPRHAFHSTTACGYTLRVTRRCAFSTRACSHFSMVLQSARQAIRCTGCQATTRAPLRRLVGHRSRQTVATSAGEDGATKAPRTAAGSMRVESGLA